MDLLSSDKKSIILRVFLLALALLVFFYLFNNYYLFQQREISPPPIPSSDVISADLLVGTPVHIRIPAIGVDAEIQKVNKSAKGNMGVPDNYTDVGWYEPGPKPGEMGNAVIDGHVDNGWGLKAVFYNLNKLNAGDRIYVVDDKGNETIFVVNSSETYDYKKAPLEKIFGPSEIPALNLITCAGTWLENEKTNDKRLVVYAQKVI